MDDAPTRRQGSSRQAMTRKPNIFPLSYSLVLLCFARRYFLKKGLHVIHCGNWSRPLFLTQTCSSRSRASSP